MSDRKNLKIAFLFIVFLVAGGTHQVQAALTPLSVSIVPPIQFPPSDYNIVGARLSLIYGKHRDMSGLDLGVIGNVTDQDFTGLAISGGFNLTYGSTTAIGAQLAGLTNINFNKTNVVGLQASLLVNYNEAASMIAGFQIAGLANISKFTDVNGIQLALYNHAKVVRGFQIGLINIADELRGIQIGLVNVHLKGLFYVSPIINIGF